MAKNTGDGYREGEVRGRSQAYNPETKKWVKRDSETEPRHDFVHRHSSVGTC